MLRYQISEITHEYNPRGETKTFDVQLDAEGKLDEYDVVCQFVKTGKKNWLMNTTKL